MNASAKRPARFRVTAYVDNRATLTITARGAALLYLDGPETRHCWTPATFETCEESVAHIAGLARGMDCDESDIRVVEMDVRS